MRKKQNIQTEADAAYLYDKLAQHESDETIAGIFRQMGEIERGHAKAFLKGGTNAVPPPSWRARVLNGIGRIFGYDYVLGVLMDTEKSLSQTVVRSKINNALPLTGGEHNHVRILESLMQRGAVVSAKHITRFEKRHRSVGGNALRAAVLGGNDGLISNFGLIMGVAGATTGGEEVLLTGVAGLLAGALSMALGEWISVKSSQELAENQVALEKEELETNPEGEKRELQLIYMAKGIPEEQAAAMAAKLIGDKSRAHEVLVQEELGINADELQGSALEAALYSFGLFAAGAIIPLMPFFFISGNAAIIWSVALSAIGLFLIGAAITLFTGRSIWYSGARQVLFGLLTAAVTFGIGYAIGVSVTG